MHICKYQKTAVPFSKCAYVHILSIDKDFCEVEMSQLSATLFLNVCTVFLDSSSLFMEKSYHYLHFHFCDVIIY